MGVSVPEGRGRGLSISCVILRFGGGRDAGAPGVRRVTCAQAGPLVQREQEGQGTIVRRDVRDRLADNNEQENEQEQRGEKEDRLKKPKNSRWVPPFEAGCGRSGSVVLFWEVLLCWRLAFPSSKISSD